MNEGRGEQGRPTILVAEDNYLAAAALCTIVRDCGFAVAGPAARLDQCLDIVARSKVDGALVDINLGAIKSYPLCVALAQRKVPFALVSGVVPPDIPAAFRAAPLIVKPADPGRIRIALDEFTAASAARSQRPRAPSVNGILDRLEPEDRDRLGLLMEPIVLDVGISLESPGTVPTHLVFPNRGVVSISVSVGSHRVEAGMVGREGMTGIAGLMDCGPSGFEATVQVPGAALRIPTRALLDDVAGHGRLQHRLLGGAYDFMRQVAETTLASARGTVEERVARWILMMCDRLEDDEIVQTHSGIAAALGVRRAGVTVALHILEGKQAILSDRKRVRITDRYALRVVAGRFYVDPEQGNG